MKTLIIDDDEIVRKQLAQVLHNMGYQTIQSGNGRHAWETLWENKDITLIVTDVMMPDMDGRELLQLIRGNSLFKELPVVVLSGVASEDIIGTMLSLGHCAYCSKPIDSKAFKDCVAHVLEK